MKIIEFKFMCDMNPERAWEKFPTQFDVKEIRELYRENGKKLYRWRKPKKGTTLGDIKGYLDRNDLKVVRMEKDPRVVKYNWVTYNAFIQPDYNKPKEVEFQGEDHSSLLERVKQVISRFTGEIVYSQRKLPGMPAKIVVEMASKDYSKYQAWLLQQQEVAEPPWVNDPDLLREQRHQEMEGDLADRAHHFFY